MRLNEEVNPGNQWAPNKNGGKPGRSVRLTEVIKQMCLTTSRYGIVWAQIKWGSALLSYKQWSLWAVLAPPIVQTYPLSVFQRLLHPHKNDGMQSRSVFNSYYQTVIHMQVHSNRLHNSDARSGQGLDSRVLLWTPPPCTPLFQNSGKNTPYICTWCGAGGGGGDGTASGIRIACSVISLSLRYTWVYIQFTEQ